jgi:hypothetical protein
MMIRSAFAALVLAVPAFAVHADEMAEASAGDKLKQGAEKTGAVIEKGVNKAADAVETTAKRTGEGISIGVKKGAEAVKRVAVRASEAVERGADKVKETVGSSPMPAK